MAAAIERLYRVTMDASKAMRSLNRLEQSTGKIDNKLQKTGAAFAKVGSLAAKAFAGIAGGAGLVSIIKLADSIALTEASFAALTESASRGSDMMQRVYDIAYRTGAPLQGVARNTQQLTVGLKAMGSTNEDIAQISENFVKLGRVSGKDIGDINSALYQFSQALASGRLQGDEFRSIMERVPIIMQYLAKSINRPIGELKQLAKEGKLTTSVLVKAMLGSTEEINRLFATLPITFEQSMNRLSTAASEFAVAFTDAFALNRGAGEALLALTNIVRALASAMEKAAPYIQSFGRNIGQFVKDLGSLASALVGSTSPLTAWGSSLGIAGVAILLLRARIVKSVLAIKSSLELLYIWVRLNPWGALLTAAAAAAVAIIANWDKVRLFFLYKVPQFIELTKVKFYSFADSVGEAMYTLKSKVEKVWSTMINGLIGPIRSAIEALNEAFGLEIPAPELHEWDEGAGYVRKFGEEMKAAADSSVFFGKKYTSEMNKLIDKAEETGGALEEVTTRGSRRGDNEEYAKWVDGIRSSLDSLLLTITKAETPFYEIREQFKLLGTARAAGLIETDQELAALFKRLSDMHNSRVIADMQEEWDALFQAAKLEIDPSLGLKAQIDRLNELRAQLKLTDDQYALVAKHITETWGKANSAIDDTLSIQQELVNRAPDFGREFSSTIIDGMEKGKIAFADFAKSILQQIAKILLDRIFVQFAELLAGAFTNTSSGAPAGVPTVPQTYGPAAVAGFLGPGLSPFGGPAASRLSAPMGQYNLANISQQKASQGPQVRITVNNNAPVDVEVEQRQRGDRIDIGIMIEEQMAKSFGDGGLDRNLASNFGIRRRAF